MPGATVGLLTCFAAPLTSIVPTGLKLCCWLVSIPFFGSGSALLSLADGIFAKAGLSPCREGSRGCDFEMPSDFCLFASTGSGCSSCLASAGKCVSSGTLPESCTRVANAFSFRPGPKPIFSSDESGARIPAEGAGATDGPENLKQFQKTDNSVALFSFLDARQRDRATGYWSNFSPH